MKLKYSTTVALIETIRPKLQTKVDLAEIMSECGYPTKPSELLFPIAYRWDDAEFRTETEGGLIFLHLPVDFHFEGEEGREKGTFYLKVYEGHISGDY